ncbi:LytTR family transcriptional regulator DNA-binding domain-containing protein [Geomicrobium sediminis]|uniref:ABC-2 type transport system ATP-binding protein n=1 Tax=Geomicrobium sediminis TaxID=1347788 RepID=A0ABS2PD21_9BACL|nr:LytTR family transcriptional regulator DNA-binding domain-containing protein [Geomicrobium sediminis]MBM7633308.1 ABC-2 type transport system ATP-binding protein [Geomicrobium sediminis]
MYTITNLEIVQHGHVVVPSFDLTVNEGDFAIIHCSAKQGNVLLHYLHTQRQNKDHITFSQQKQIGYFMLEDTLYERLSVFDNLAFFHNLYNSKTDLNEILSTWGLTSFQSMRYVDLDDSIKRRVLIARAIIHEPSIVILENPYIGVDHETKQLISNNLILYSNRAKAVLLTLSDYDVEPFSLGRQYKMTNTTLVELSSEDALPTPFKKIAAKQAEKTLLFNPEEIDYIEAIDGECLLYVNEQSYVSPFTLQALEQQLVPFGFFRTHRSYLVNLQRVREVMQWTRNSYTVVIAKYPDGVPLAKSKLPLLYETLGIVL